MSAENETKTQIDPMLEDIGNRFRIKGKFGFGRAIGSGHIHDTYAATYRSGSRTTRYIHQRINESVFKEPKRLMENISVVTRHQTSTLKPEPGFDPDRSVLKVVPASDGRNYIIDSRGKYWRTFCFIEHAYTRDRLEHPSQAEEAARAFGMFHKTMKSLDPGRLHEIIPGFHDTAQRVGQLELAIEKDPMNRAGDCGREIEFVNRQRSVAGVLSDLLDKGMLPIRIIHNDTKINNVMFDQSSHQGLCVIDLDTVMPGILLFDFGDMVRSAGNPAADDEKNPDKAAISLPVFQALVNGYLSVTRNMLTGAELEHLVFSSKLLAFELGVRFLTDYLTGDVYFKTRYPGQNLSRCRSQFKLFESIEQNEGRMEAIVRNHL